MSAASLATGLSADGVVLRATLLVTLAWLVSALLSKAGASAAMRHLVWLLGFAGLLLVPLLMAVMPIIPLVVLPQAPPTPHVAGLATTGRGWAGALWIIYLTGAGVMTARLGVGRLLLASRWRAAAPADAGWERSLARLRPEVGLHRNVRLRLAEGPVMPITWGTLAPRLLLPREAASWPEDRRRIVLLHELAHVRRRDSLGQSIAAVACALYWFHPAVWLAARRLRLEQEHAADDLVLAAGAEAMQYARGLLAFAAGLGQDAPPPGAVAVSSSWQLERRLAAIVGGANRARPTSTSAAASAGLALAITWLVALAVPVAATTPLALEPPQPRRVIDAVRVAVESRSHPSGEPLPAAAIAMRRPSKITAAVAVPSLQASAGWNEQHPATQPVAALAPMPATPMVPPPPIPPTAPDPVPPTPPLPPRPVAPAVPATTPSPPTLPTAPQ